MNLSYIFVFICFMSGKVFGGSENKNRTIEKSFVKSIENALALEVLKSTFNSTTNTVVSVLPLQFTLCKLAAVAVGAARQELLKILGFSNESMINNFYLQLRENVLIVQQADLTYVNKLYVNYKKPIETSFIKNSTMSYGVHVEKVGFDYPRTAIRFINKGIASATYRRVEDVLLPDDITNLTSMLLVTAGHFKPTWEDAFNTKQTQLRPFVMMDHTRVQIPMMYTLEECFYHDARDFKVLTKRLIANQCSMTFIQPDFLPLDRILQKLEDPDFMKNIRQKMSWKQVRLIMPRMKIKSRINLNEYLKKLGIKEILSKNTTGLNGILSKSGNGSNMFVSNVLQKIFLEADEYGVSRVVRDLYNNAPPREHSNTLEVLLDRPFYFSVDVGIGRERKDVFQLFSGIYYKPEPNEIQD